MMETNNSNGVKSTYDYKHSKTVSNIYSTLKQTLFIIGSSCFIFIVLSNSLSYQIQRYWGASGNFWQHQWEQVLALTNNDPYTIIVYGSILGGYVVYWAVGSMFTFFDFTGLLSKYKVQPGTNENVCKTAFLRVVAVVHFNQLIVSGLMAHLFYKLSVLRGCDQSRMLPTFHRVLFDLAVFLLVEEIGFYYAHRLFHHRLFYKRFHKLHHEWQAPISVTSIYAHPLEHALANVLPVFTGPLIMGSHAATIYLWYIIAIMNTLNSHSGYHLPFFPSPESHDFHHLKFNECFGVLGILDFLHGTDEKFRESKNFQRHIMMLSFIPPRVEFPDEDPSDKKMKTC